MIVYDLGAFESTDCSAITHSVVPVHYETSDATMKWVLLSLWRHLTNIIEMIRTSSKLRVLRFVASRRASNGGGAGPSGVRSGEIEVFGVVVVQDTDKENWDLDGVIIAAEAKRNGL